MLKFGIIGMNEGNGHPYSYSAVFNGYNEKALEQECPFEIIKKYLKQHHRNQVFIKDAVISHIWTQDRAISEKIARVANIPNIANSIADLAEKVDAIIFARDDMWNHWEMAGALFRTGKPVYMDKLLAHNRADLKNFITASGFDYPLMTASSFRFAPEVEKAKAAVDFSKVKTIYGISPCIWVRYAPHLLDPLFYLCGHDLQSVQNSGSDKADTVCLTYKTGMQAVLQVLEGVSLPIALTCHSGDNIPPYDILYTDPSLESYFLSITNMMTTFTDMVRTGCKPTPFEDTVFLNKVVLTAIESRECSGRKILIDKIIQSGDF